MREGRCHKCKCRITFTAQHQQLASNVRNNTFIHSLSERWLPKSEQGGKNIVHVNRIGEHSVCRKLALFSKETRFAYILTMQMILSQNLNWGEA